MDIAIKGRCPICGGVDCGLYIGYYFREVIGEDGRYYNAFPIARYVCRGKGTNKTINHKTFSLLPYQLVPYTKYSLPFIIKALKLQHKEGLSIFKLQDYLARLGEKEILSISAGQIVGFKKLIMESVNKLIAMEYYSEFEGTKESEGGAVIFFIEFAEGFECLIIDPSIRGPCGLGYDFYLRGGGYMRNAHFLFGSPSQFRNPC